MIALETRATTREALEEIQELLNAACFMGSPHRLAAVRYTQCRTALLESEVRSVIPGFVVQCVSLYKFHEFINLYDPQAETRMAFVEDAFGASRAMLDSKRIYDVFSDPEF